jgi:type I restriction enzyme S subunit
VKADPVQLGEVASLISGGTPDKKRSEYYVGGTVPWITSADIVEGDVRAARTHVTPLGIERSAASIAEQGTPLLVTRTGVGKVAVAPTPLAFSQDITAVVPDPARLDGRYLIWLLRSRRRWLEDRSRGATIKGITHDVVLSTPVPLPSLDEQRRIARALDAAQALRTRRLRAIWTLDAFRDSLMEVSHAKPGVSRALGELLERIESGKSPVCEDRPVAGGEWGVLKLGAVSMGDYRPEHNKAVLPGTSPLTELEVREGDVLLARKNTLELVGASAYVRDSPPRMLLPDLIFRLVPRPDSGVRPSYLQAALARPQARAAIRRLAGGSAGSMPNISKERLRTVEVTVPPLKTQERFEQRVDRVAGVRQRSITHLAHLDALFASLEHRAFTGAL